MYQRHLNIFQQMMTVTAEDSSELAQECMKLMRLHKDDRYIPEPEWQELKDKLSNVFCMIELFVETGVFEWGEIFDKAEVKKEELKAWSALLEK